MNPQTRVDQCLLLFAKCPVPGKVKTRLIPSLGTARTTRLYRRLLEHAIAQAQAYRSAEVEFWLDPSTEVPSCLEFLRLHHLTLHRQGDGDLGRRMHGALRAALRSADKAVLMGADCPDISAAVLHEAFQTLRTTDAVFAPATDGGYVLIGVRKTDPLLFDAIPWSSEHVMAETRSRLQQLGWKWRELAPLQDIDDHRDLTHWFVQSVLN